MNLAVAAGVMAGASAVQTGAEVFAKLYKLLEKQPHQLDVSDKRSPEVFEAILEEIATSAKCNFSVDGKVWALLSSREALGGNQHSISLSWVPGADAQKIEINGVPFLVSRIKDMHEEVLRMQTKDFEAGPKVLRELVNDAMIHWENKHRGRVRVYVWSNGAWKMNSSLEKRPMDSLVLPEDIRILREEIRSFFKSKLQYSQLRIPWRRGYLFYGVPGTGKSSFVLSLASELEKDIFVVELHDGMSNEVFRAAFRDVPSGAILLMEDIDTATVTHKREGKKDNSNSSMTLSTILNELDGVTSKEGRLVVMTTNHIELLDDALIRPGRVDKAVQFNPLTFELFLKLISRFFGKPSDDICKDIYEWFFTIVQPDPVQCTLAVLEANGENLARSLFDNHFHVFIREAHGIPISRQVFDLFSETPPRDGLQAYLSPAQLQGALLRMMMDQKPFLWPILRSELNAMIQLKREHMCKSVAKNGLEPHPVDVEEWFRTWNERPASLEILREILPALEAHPFTIQDAKNCTPAYNAFIASLTANAKAVLDEERALLLLMYEWNPL